MFRKHSKVNLASSNTPNLTHFNCITWKTRNSTVNKGRDTTFEKFELQCILH